MTFALETDVPVPVRTGSGGRSGSSKYPFPLMEPGHSFLVPGDIKSQTVRSAVSAYQKRVGESAGKFSVRTVGDGVRVWRTE